MTATWHSGLPWDEGSALYRWVRREFFSADRPGGEYILVPGEDPAALEQVYGQQSFAPNWEFSYNKRGEALNLARVKHEKAAHADAVPGVPIVWWQDHLRGWEHDGGTMLRCHWEPEPTEHPRPHLSANHQNSQRGMINARRVLEARNIDWEMVEWTADGGVVRE